MSENTTASENNAESLRAPESPRPGEGSPKVAAVCTTILDVPLIRPHRFATTTATAQPILLVEVTTDDGITGYGEGVVPGDRGGEASRWRR